MLKEVKTFSPITENFKKIPHVDTQCTLSERQSWIHVLMNPMMLLYGFIKHMYFTWIIKVFSFYTVKLLRFYYFYSF